MRVERALVVFVCVAAMSATGCTGGKLAYNLPPSSRLMEPGPGVGGPGPGVIPPVGSPYGMYGGAVGRFGNGEGAYIGGGYGGASGECADYEPMPSDESGMAGSAGVMQASYAGGCEGCQDGGECGCGPDGCDIGGCDCEGGYVQQAGLGHGGRFGGRLHGMLGRHGFVRPGSVESYADSGAGAGMATSQIAFLGDDGIMVSWDVGMVGAFDSSPLVIPGRQDFYQGAIYRLRVSNIPGRPGVELFPTLEVAPVTPRTDAYLAHSPIPVQFTEEDFDQVLSGNFVTKVIYLPDPEFQELALAGVETLVSTRLDPGVDPIAEADRRGSILAILRMGNKDLRGGGAATETYEPEVIVPASHTEQGQPQERQAVYNEELNASGQPAGEGVVPAQYCGAYGDGAYDGGYYDGSTASMPMGMQTSGFAPPNMIAGAPQWGMPITGTPIGLPGPPHVPLGVPAGLQRHTMKNRTRVMLPPPTSAVHLSVKQRPGLNYPRPVNHVYVDETQREPFRLAPGWLSNLFAPRSPSARYAQGANCQ